MGDLELGEDDMTIKELQTYVASYEERMRREDERARQAIDKGMYAVAANAVAAAAAHQGAIDELLFLMDELEKEDE